MNENREIVQRAIGILEGAMFFAPQKVADAIATAAEMLDALLVRKEQNNERECGETL